MSAPVGAKRYSPCVQGVKEAESRARTFVILFARVVDLEPRVRKLFLEPLIDALLHHLASVRFILLDAVVVRAHPHVVVHVEVEQWSAHEDGAVRIARVVIGSAARRHDGSQPTFSC